jgi:glycerol uptake facilitator-like aquaporin
VIYIILQLTGGIIGALAAKALLPTVGEPVNWGAVAISPALGGVFPAFMVELAGTFFLMWAIVGVAVNPRGSAEWAGFAIGATLGLGVLVAAGLTGAGFNPARAFGPALVSGQFGDVLPWLLVYIVAPLVGAVLASAVYFRVAMAPGAKGVGGAEPVG